MTCARDTAKARIGQVPGSWHPQGNTIPCDLSASFMHAQAHENYAEHREALLRKAAKLTGVSEKTSLIRRGLAALIARESARRLAELGGTEKRLSPVRRRRPSRV